VERLRRQSLTITDAGETWSSWTGTGTWNRWADSDLHRPLGRSDRHLGCCRGEQPSV